MGYITTLLVSQIWECLLSFGSQSFLYPFAVYEYKDWNIENYNFARYFVWLWNYVSYFKKDNRERGAEEYNLVLRGRKKRKAE